MVPEKIHILPFGRHRTEKGTFSLDEKGMETIIRDFNARKNDMVIDYEHQTLMDVEAPAAGWIKRLVNKGREGLWAEVEWTSRAIRYIKNREYRYLSPVFLKNSENLRPVRLINAALTNQPAIDGMTPVAAALYGASFRIDSNPSRLYAAVPHKNISEVKVMERILEILGLPPETEDDRVIRKLEALVARSSALKGVCGIAGLDEDTPVSEIEGTVMAFKKSREQVEALNSTVKELREKLRLQEVEKLVQQAMKEGKVTPAQHDWAKGYAGRDPEGFRAFVAKAPTVVPTGEVSGNSGPVVGSGRIDDTQLEVNKALGLDPETFEKHNNEKED
jgi:phage I-like protein